MKVRDIFRDQVLMLRVHPEGWILSLRSPNGDEDLFRLYRTRQEALEAIDVWMEAMEDDTDLPASVEVREELRALMLETLRRIHAGQPPLPGQSIETEHLRQWFEREMGEGNDSGGEQAASER